MSATQKSSLRLSSCIFFFFSKNSSNNPMFHTRVRAAAPQRVLTISIDVISVIVGSLLGDCYGSKRSVEGTRPEFFFFGIRCAAALKKIVYKQSIVHKDDFFFFLSYSERIFRINIYKYIYLYVLYIYIFIQLFCILYMSSEYFAYGDSKLYNKLQLRF